MEKRIKIYFSCICDSNKKRGENPYLLYIYFNVIGRQGRQFGLMQHWLSII